MQGISKNLKARIEYQGGNQLNRLKQGKLQTLNAAIKNSYQSETVVLEDGREFRCLINPNKISMELDDKMLSIPFEAVCLNTSLPSLPEVTNIAVGQSLMWKENGSHWLVYMQYLQEDAYFRGLMRQCNTEVEIGNKKYWVYLKGPSEKGINWQKTSSFVFNKLNYTLEMYISNNQETNEFFHRFKKIKVKGRPWEVQAIDDITTEGIIAVYLKEDYTNEFAETEVEDSQPENDSTIEPGLPHIVGDSNVYPFDIKTYQVMNIAGGVWSLSNKNAKILTQSDSSVEIEITTGKSGSVDLIYTMNDGIIVFPITIQSL